MPRSSGSVFTVLSVLDFWPLMESEGKGECRKDQLCAPYSDQGLVAWRPLSSSFPLVAREEESSENATYCRGFGSLGVGATQI